MEGFAGETEDSIWGSDFEYEYGDTRSIMTPYYSIPSYIGFYDGTDTYGSIYLTFKWKEDDQTVFPAEDSRGSGDYEIEIILNNEKTAAQVTVISLNGVDLSAYGGTSGGTLTAEYLLKE